MGFLQKAILKTLAYADIFDYPLTAEELFRFLIADKRIDQVVFKRAVSKIFTGDEQIETDGRYFFLKGRQKIVDLRKDRERWSQDKLRIAAQVAIIFEHLPFLKMVGVTGALAMNNSSQDDDIDFLLITSKNRLWLARLLTILVTELQRKRRRLKERNIKDKVCLNIFWDESHLVLPVAERNLFTAHEICQVKPLWGKGRTYENFLRVNRWTAKYLPNFYKAGEFKKEITNDQSLISSPFDFLEKIAYKVQLLYMRSRKTTEKVESYRAFFHPREGSRWVLAAYSLRLRKLGLEL
jgi:hypothetical protein